MSGLPALLLLALGITADATLGQFLKTQTQGKTANSLSYSGACKSMGKTYQGFSWSMGGGATTIQITCSGVQISLVCKGWPKFTAPCTSASADGKQGGGCVCASAHPTCKSNGWCYKGNSWSTTHCPGSCTDSANAQAKCSCPAAFPHCKANKWCYKSATSGSYSSQCGGECSAATVPAPAPSPKEATGCTCSGAYPFCYTSNQWCYKSPTSSAYTQTCAGKCTASAPAPSPAGGKAPAPTSGGQGTQEAVVASCGGKFGFTQIQAQEMVDFHNKMRCAVGTPPLQWNGALQCQAQDQAEKIHAFQHSDSYNLPISAGENLAGGIDVSTAVWMWFTEYAQKGTRGHYTAMVWKSVSEIGCGIWKGGSYGGNIRCQYKGSPNMAGQYDANVPAFKGEKAKFAKCGLTISEVRAHVKKFQGWGIIKPDATLSASLGLYEDEPVAWATASSGMVAMGVALASAVLAVVGVALGVRRHRQRTFAVLPSDEEVPLSGTE